jgi:hypothetical protein
MPIFLCRWQDGNFSVVNATSKDHAVELLDEFANAEGCSLMAIKDFMAHFRLTDEGDFALESYGEVTLNQIMDLGYPVLNKTFQAEEPAKESRKGIRLAVCVERERLLPGKIKEPKTLAGRLINAAIDMPGTMADRIGKDALQETPKDSKRKR